MNNVIRATTAIMGIIRYPGLHVRQQTTRTDAHACVRTCVCAYVRACARSTCESRALFLLRRVNPPCRPARVHYAHLDAPAIGGVKAQRT